MFALGIIGDALAGQRVIVAARSSSGSGGWSWTPGSRPPTTSPASAPESLTVERVEPTLRGRAGAPRPPTSIPTRPAATSTTSTRSQNPVERRLVARVHARPSTSWSHAPARARPTRSAAARARSRSAWRGAGSRVRGTDAFPEVVDEARRRAAAAGVEVELRGDAGRGARPARPTRPSWSSAARCSSTSRTRAGRSTSLARAGRPVADRERAARAALAGAEPRRGSATWARSATRPATCSHWSQAGVRPLPRAALRGRRGAQPAPLDDGAVQGAMTPRRPLGPRQRRHARDRLRSASAGA